jgi:hypothetical protein
MGEVAMTGVFQKLGLLAGILLCILVARRLYLRGKRINPHHVRIRFRKGPRPADPGKRLFLAERSKVRHFFSLFLLLLIFIAFLTLLKPDGENVFFGILAGLAFIAFCACVFSMPLSKVAFHENAILVGCGRMISGKFEIEHLFWLNEYDRLESFDMNLFWDKGKGFRRSFSWRLIEGGKIIHGIDGPDYDSDLSEVEKIYTTANPNIERIENYGKRLEGAWTRRGFVPPPED